MQYLSPRALIATGMIAVSFLFLSFVQTAVGTIFWVVILLAITVVSLFFAPRLTRDSDTRSHVIIPLLIAVIGFVSLYVLTESSTTRWIIFAVAIFVVFTVLSAVYRSHVPAVFRSRHLVPIVRMALYAGLYGFFSAAFGMIVFLQVPVWLLALLCAAVAGLSAWSLLHLAGFDDPTLLPISISVSVLIFEFFWVLTFLPVGYAAQGWMLAALLYSLVQGVAFFSHTTARLKGRSRTRLITALLSVIIVVVIARWV